MSLEPGLPDLDLTAPAREPTSPLFLPDFQATGVSRAGRILDRYNGVLIADPTGAGKTFMALALIEEGLRRAFEPVLVTSPASLRGLWLGHLRRIGRKRFRQTPDPGSAPSSSPPAITWLSHTALSLGRWPRRLECPRFVVVDEAHAFRNPRTRRYRALARLCRAARVVLLTATPVHNSLLDLYFQLRLFLSDDGLADLGVPDLRRAFHRATAWPGPMPESLVTGLEQISIRRSRKEIEDQLRRPPRTGRGDGVPVHPALRFPLREPPAVVAWSQPDDGVAAACATLEALDLLPFRLSDHGGTGSELMRFHLLKRLESSAAAFSDSIERLTRYFRSFLEAGEQGFLLRPDDRRALTRGSSDAQLFFAPLALQPLTPQHDWQALASSVARDLGALCYLDNRLRADFATGDPKIAALDRLLSSDLANRTVLVFTEFRSTASELWRVLGRRHRVGLIHGGASWLGTSRAARTDVVRAFAPRANGASVPEAQRVRVLIATDVLAEGWNLQDAGDVVSFDLPWNPVRLIQRIGRIDRLGSSHPSIRCHNFMPDHYLDALLRLVERLATKLDAIRSASGETAGVLDPAPSAVHAATRGVAFLRRLGSRGTTAFAAFADVESAAVSPGIAPVAIGPTATTPGMAVPTPTRPDVAAPSRLRQRLLRLLVQEPGGASEALCLRADRILEFLAAPHRIGVEFELDAIERELRASARVTLAAPSSSRAVLEMLDVLERVQQTNQPEK
jgi:superfamily II DNA or RNA helicase